MVERENGKKPLPPRETAAQFELLLEERERDFYVLRLYVTGMTVTSQRAIRNIKKICEQHLAGRYQLEVIDIYEHPQLAAQKQIIAAPTLVKELPLPLRRFIGDLSKTERILVDLNIGERG